MTEQPDFPTKERLGREFQRRLRAEEVATHRRRPFLVLAPVVALLFAFVAAVLLIGPGGGSDSIGPSSAEAALSDIADKVDASGDSLTLSGSDLLFQREFGTGGEFYSASYPPEKFHIEPGTYSEFIVEKWIDRDGNSWNRFTAGPEASPQIKKSTVQQGSFAMLDGPLTYEETISLLRDPDELYRRLSDGGRDSRAMLSRITDLMSLPLPTDLQAALTETAARIPGASLTGDVDTPYGDMLTAISYPTGQGFKWELLFDPVSGEYRGRTSVLPSGVRLFFSLIFDRTVVPALGDAPEGGLTDLPPGEPGREQAATETPAG